MCLKMSQQQLVNTGLPRKHSISKASKESICSLEPDDVEADYSEPSPPSTTKSQIFNPKDYSEVEQYVRQTPVDAAESFETLLRYLCNHLESDVAKVRAIFCWLVHQKVPMLINQQDIPPPDTPVGYLHLVRERKGTYSKLFSVLCRQAGIHCAVIHGVAKGVSYEVGNKVSAKDMKNSWNAVFVEGSWRLVHPSWAAKTAGGFKTGKWAVVDCPDFHDNDWQLEETESHVLQSTVNDFYFFTDPHIFIHKCFPSDKKWQLLKKTLSVSQFEEQPFLQPAFFELGLKLVKDTKCVIHVVGGFLELKIQIPSDKRDTLQFSYKLFRLRDFSDEGEYEYFRMERFVLHYLTEDFAVFEIRFPPISNGDYKLEICCRDLVNPLPSDWICDFKVICDGGMKECIPLPIVPRIGWGAGLALKTHGIVASSHKDGKVCLDKSLVTSFKFEISKDVDIHADLIHYSKPKSELTDCLEVENENLEVTIKVKPTTEGEYALQIFCRDKGTINFENVCNFLVKRTLVVENPSSFEIRQRLMDATSSQNPDELSSLMEEFVRKGLEDRGDLLKAKRKFLLCRVNKEIKEAMETRDLDKLERTMHNLSDTSLKRQLGSLYDDADALRARLRKLKRLQLAVLEMDSKTISELRSYPKPPSAVHGVMIATFLLLGNKETEIKKWSKVQGQISKKGKAGLKKRVATFDWTSVKPENLKRARQILGKYDLESVKIASAGAATFYQWATNMIHDIDGHQSTETEQVEYDKE